MDKGQHIRLLITDNSEKNVVALATDLTFHLSAATEDSTTKDSSDTNGEWNEYDVTNRSGDIQFSALVGVGTDPYSPATTEPAAPEVIGGLSFADWINKMGDTPINWKLVMVSSTNNRLIGKTICSGQGKLSNLTAQGSASAANATYSGTLNIYGAVTVGTD